MQIVMRLHKVVENAGNRNVLRVRNENLGGGGEPNHPHFSRSYYTFSLMKTQALRALSQRKVTVPCAFSMRKGVKVEPNGVK